MRPTISQLRQWNPESFTESGTCASTAAEALDTGIGRAVSALDSMTSWHGRTHDAARRRLDQEHDHADEVRNVLQMIADEALDAGTGLAYARDRVLRLVEAANGEGFRVAENGTVTHPDPARSSSAAELTYTIAAGLDTIDELDEMHGARLDGYASDLASMIDGAPDVTLPGGSSMDADAAVRMLESLAPDRRRGVVEKMSRRDVRRLIQANPHVMGNLPGIPFEWRVVANEINIRNALADEVQAGRGLGRRAQTLRDMLTPTPDPSNPYPHAGDDGLAERQFISFVNTPRGRAVEMIGRLRPNTRNVAVYVPGTGTDLDSANGDNRRAATELANQTNGPVFLYLDGELPRDLRAATSPGPAIEMGGRLAIFGHELDAELARHAPTAKSTFVGHSYGGSVVGTAEQLGLTPDRVIYASSAGTGALDLPRASGVERYSLTFPGDPIHLVQSLPGNPHGADPDTAPGVTRLDTGAVEIDGQPRVGGYRTHGAYWNDPDSTAFQNMVKVITGAEPDRYVERRPDTPGPPVPGLLPWWNRLLDPLDGDIDVPGPIPDIPLRLPW
ncbi:hypothetical protein [Gordonia aurantiaca]|uniref:hypothetical protein n=1 Tax=Gordonia sp. B21 TaxID=3151852 RepID=UPI00326717C8